MTRLPDFHERGEARAERYVLADGKVQCAGCDGAFDPVNVQASSVDPYSAPVCDQCMSEMCHRREEDEIVGPEAEKHNDEPPTNP